MTEYHYAAMIGVAAIWGWVMGYGMAKERYNVISPITKGLLEAAANMSVMEKFSGLKPVSTHSIAICGQKFLLTMERAE